VAQQKGFWKRLDEAAGRALDKLGERNQANAARLGAKGRVSQQKCSFCGKRLKVADQVGLERYGVCHHCGRDNAAQYRA
jgi:hypothetical protein